MTDPTEAARLEHEHPGRSIPQAEQDGWLKTLPGKFVGALQPIGFDPMAPISDLAARLLGVSNGLWDHPTDGPRWAVPGTTRHAGYVYQREPK